MININNYLNEYCKSKNLEDYPSRKELMKEAMNCFMEEHLRTLDIAKLNILKVDKDIPIEALILETEAYLTCAQDLIRVINEHPDRKPVSMINLGNPSGQAKDHEGAYDPFNFSEILNWKGV